MSCLSCRTSDACCSMQDPTFGYVGLVASRHMGSQFPEQDRSCVTCVRSWILSHWTTREAPVLYTPLCWGSGHSLGGTSASGSLTSCCQRVGQGCGIRMLHPGRICSQAHGVVGRIQVLVGCWTGDLGSTWLLVGTALNSLPLGPLQCGSLHH